MTRDDYTQPGYEGPAETVELGGILADEWGLLGDGPSRPQGLTARAGPLLRQRRPTPCTPTWNASSQPGRRRPTPASPRSGAAGYLMPEPTPKVITGPVQPDYANLPEDEAAAHR